MSFYKIRPRSGTAAQWERANTVLAEREIGYEIPADGTGSGLIKMKQGDGKTAWKDLSYAILLPEDKGVTDQWSKTKSYTAWEYAVYQNQLWRCYKANQGVTPTEGDTWTQITLKSLKENIDSNNNNLNSRVDGVASRASELETFKNSFGWSAWTSLGDNGCGVTLSYRCYEALKLVELRWGGTINKTINVNTVGYVWTGFPSDKGPKSNVFIPTGLGDSGTVIRYYPDASSSNAPKQFTLVTLLKAVSTGYICGQFIYSYA